MQLKSIAGEQGSAVEAPKILLSLVDHLDAMLAYWDINQVCVFTNNAYRDLVPEKDWINTCALAPLVYCCGRIALHRRLRSRNGSATCSLFSPACSVGIALYRGHGITPEELMVNSDRACYAAKKRGKNCYAFFGAEES